MHGGRGLRELWAVRFVVLAISVLTLAPMLVHGEASGSASSSWPSVKSNVVMIVQGENDITAGQESKDDFYALKILSYELPYDIDRVYTNVPSVARSLSVWTQSGPLNDGSFGWETEGNLTGKFYVDVPAGHPRNAEFVNTTGNESAFMAQGSEFSNTVFSSGSLHLESGYESGYFVSADMPVSGAHNIVAGNLSLSGARPENVTIFLSNDAGSTWTLCSNGTEIAFSTFGTVLKVMLALDGNSTLAIEPFVTSFTLSASSESLKTAFSVHISYLWTEAFESRRAPIDLTEVVPYTTSGSFVVMVYSVKGYVPHGSGFELTLDEDREMSTYPDKDLYLYSASAAPSANMSVYVLAPKTSYDWLLFVAGGAVLLAALGFAYMRRSGSRRRSASSDKPAESVGEAPDDKEARRRELVGRKKELLTKIEKVKGGTGPAGDRKRELSSLREELKEVRNELNKLPKAQASSNPAEPEVGGPSSGQYDAMIASLARLDDDHEKGRLPEDTYRSLRKDYVSKAVALRAAREMPRSADPLSTEKSKLMEAILALTEEHDAGDVDEEVYKELRASYRKELAAVMRKIDEGRKEE